MSTCVLEALPGKLGSNRHSPSILYISTSLAMSTSVPKALPRNLDIKRHSPSILYIHVGVLDIYPCLAFIVIYDMICTYVVEVVNYVEQCVAQPLSLYWQ